MSSDIDRLGLGTRDTKIEGFHQVIAVTQGSINHQLMQQHHSSNVLQNLKIASEVDPDTGEPDAELSASLNPMQIQLNVGRDSFTVLCYLSLRTGTFKINSGKKPVEVKIANWRLAFKVDIKLEWKPDDKVPQRIKDQLTQAGDYSVKKLILDFTTADIMNYDVSNTLLPGLTEGVSIHAASKRTIEFTALIKSWLDGLKAQDDTKSHNIIGYSVTINNPKSAYPSTPSLVPTSMTHQNYSFLANRAQEPISDLFGDKKHIADNNMFLYLEMTNNDPLPKAALNYHANWVVNEPGQPVKDGTLAIAKNSFFDGYLLKNLAAINRDTAIRAIKADHEGYEINKIKFDFQLGRMFEKNSDLSLCKWEKTDNPLIWKYEPPPSVKNSEYDSIATQALKIRGALTCTVKNQLEIIPGSNEIQVSGDMKVEKIRHANFLNGGDYTYQQKWRISIKLDSIKKTEVAEESGQRLVEKLGLVVKTTVEIDKPKEDRGSKGHLFAADDAQHAAELGQIIHMGVDVDRTVSELNSFFSGPWNFYFPGSGVFLLKNPRFNNEGDLLTELQYDEA